MKKTIITIIALVMSAPLAHADIYGPSLVGFWTFDSVRTSSGANNVIESSGKGLNGTMTNSPTATLGKVDQALNFTGTANVDVVDASDADFVGPVSISAWVYITTGSNFSMIFSKAAGAGTTNNPIEFRTDNSAVPLLASVRGVSTGVFADTSTATVSLNAWHQVAVTYPDNQDTSDLTYYIDGAAVGCNCAHLGAGAQPTGTGADILIGRRPDGLNMLGKIDDLRVYNRTLSAAEIAQIYDQQLAHTWSTF